MSEKSPVIEAIENIGTSFDIFKRSSDRRLDDIETLFKKRIDRIDRRVEEREAAEAILDRPERKPDTPAPTNFKRFVTDHGNVFELSSSAKMADIDGLGPNKTPDISLERWLAATVAGERCGDKDALAFARESKAMVTTSTGVLIPAEYQAQWIDLIRARSVLNTAGMRTATMVGKTQVHAAITDDPDATWHTEAASISADNPTFASRTLTAQTLVTRCQASVELAQDSPDFGGQLANVMTGAMATQIDRVGLEGTGTPPQPRGIKNTSGRSSQTSVGALTDYSKIINGLGALLTANGDLEQISKFAVMSPGAWTAFENLATGISSDKTQLPRPRSIQDTRFLVTSNIAGSLTSSPQIKTTIYLGDFRDLLLGVRLGSSIEVLKLDTYAGNLLLEFVGYTRVDFLVTRPASFHTIEGVAA